MDSIAAAKLDSGDRSDDLESGGSVADQQDRIQQPQRFELVEAGRVRIAVSNEKREPVTGATVYRFPTSRLEREVQSLGVTNSDGVVLVPSAALPAIVSHEGYSPKTIPRKDSPSVDVVLSRSVEQVIQVQRASDNLPVVGVGVIMSRASCFVPSRQFAPGFSGLRDDAVFASSTNEFGQASFGSLNQGHRYIWRLDTDDYVPVRVSGARGPLDVPAGLVTVSVIEPMGAAIRFDERPTISSVIAKKSRDMSDVQVMRCKQLALKRLASAWKDCNVYAQVPTLADSRVGFVDSQLVAFFRTHGWMRRTVRFTSLGKVRRERVLRSSFEKIRNNGTATLRLVVSKADGGVCDEDLRIVARPTHVMQACDMVGLPVVANGDSVVLGDLEYRLRSQHPFVAAELRGLSPFSVPASGTKELRIKLKQAFRQCTVRVLAGGVVLNAAELRLCADGYESRWGIADNFDYHWIPEGRVRVEARAYGYSAKSVSVPPGKVSDGPIAIDVRLDVD